MKIKLKTKQGFTLIELLVVIAIIGLLAAVVMASLNQARMNARDKVRMSDLEQAKAALHIYATANGTYYIAGAGSGGQGWFSYKDSGSYPKSIAEELVVLKLLTTVLHDPLVPAGTASADGHQQYMIYFTSGGATEGVCLFAHLENANTEQLATFTNAPVSSSIKSYLSTNHTMNYATCTK